MGQSYRTFKVFEWEDIHRDTDVELSDVFVNYMNDVAMKWFVEEDLNPNSCKDEFDKVHDWLLAHGAEDGEDVYINICW